VWIALVLLAIVMLAAVGWVLGPGIEWWMRTVDDVQVSDGISTNEKEVLEAKDKARGRIIAYGSGLLAVGALVFTAVNAAAARRTANAAQANVQAAQRTAEAALRSVEITERGQQRTHELTEQGLVTGRYTTAIEQLGSDKIDIRLGGIYALERIARDSARDHPTVMAVLATFVREHSHDPDAHTAPSRSPGRPEENTGGTSSSPPARTRFRPDLQAALTVIGRRNSDKDTDRIDLCGADLTGANLVDADLNGVNLNGAFLNGAHLNGAHLNGAHLSGAHLNGAHLNGAHLSGAHLVRANLNGAHLSEVDLTCANLTRANLNGANLIGAHLNDANLIRANLSGAFLNSANLREVRGLSAEEIREAASVMESTVFPGTETPAPPSPRTATENT